MNRYERIKALCKERKLTVTGIESELGFARGSLCKIDKSKPSMDKVLKLSETLGTTPEYIMYGEEPIRENLDINKALDEILKSLDNGTGLYPSGKAPQTPAEKEALINSIKLVMNTVDHMDRD